MKYKYRIEWQQTRQVISWRLMVFKYSSVFAAAFTGTQRLGRKTGLLEVFGFDCVDTESNQLTAEWDQNVRRWQPSDTKTTVKWSETWSQKHNSSHKYHSVSLHTLTRLSEDTSRNSCRSFPKMDLCVFLNGWMVPCRITHKKMIIKTHFWHKSR